MAYLLGLAVILGGNGEAARDPFSPAGEKYAYKPPSDTRTLARLKQQCARFLAAGIRKGVAANDQWDVQALRDWARGLQVCTEADDPLGCATKLDTVAAATPAEPPRPKPAPRPRPQAAPTVPPVPIDEIPKPSPTPDAGTGGVIVVVVLVAVLLVILLLAFVARSAPVVATPNPPDRCPRCGSPYFHKESEQGDVWICDMPGCGKKFEAGREEAAERESVHVAHPEPPREEPMGENLARQRTATTAKEVIGGVVAWVFLVLFSGAFVVFVVFGHRGKVGFLAIIFFGLLVSLFSDLMDRRITAILLILFLLLVLSG